MAGNCALPTGRGARGGNRGWTPARVDLPGTSLFSTSRRRSPGGGGPGGSPFCPGQPFRRGGRMGRGGAVLRVFIVRRAAQRISYGSDDRRRLTLAQSGGQRRPQPIRGSPGELSLEGRHYDLDVRSPASRAGAEP